MTYALLQNFRSVPHEVLENLLRLVVVVQYLAHLTLFAEVGHVVSSESSQHFMNIECFFGFCAKTFLLADFFSHLFELLTFFMCFIIFEYLVRRVLNYIHMFSWLQPVNVKVNILV